MEIQSENNARQEVSERDGDGRGDEAVVGRRRRHSRSFSAVCSQRSRCASNSWPDGRAASAPSGALRVLEADVSSSGSGSGGGAATAAHQLAAPQSVAPRRRPRPSAAAAARRPRGGVAASRVADADAAGNALRAASRRRRPEELVHPRHGRIQSGWDQTQEALPQ